MNKTIILSDWENMPLDEFAELYPSCPTNIKDAENWIKKTTGAKYV